MPLSREELEDMQATLKDAFSRAKSIFNANKGYSNSDADLRFAMTAIGTTAAALLQVDERLRDMDEGQITKLPAKNMPGKG